MSAFALQLEKPSTEKLPSWNELHPCMNSLLSMNPKSPRQRSRRTSLKQQFLLRTTGAQTTFLFACHKYWGEKTEVI